MKKSFFATVIVFVLLISVMAGYAASPVSVYVDMKQVNFDVEPFIDSNNSVM